MSVDTRTADLNMLIDDIEQSDDELFASSRLDHETIETLPLRTSDLNHQDGEEMDVSDDEEDDEEHETLPTQLLKSKNLNTGSSYRTQPTQLLPPQPPAVLLSSSPLRSQVQVAASSPIPTPTRPSTTDTATAPVRRAQSYLASAMAPAGTIFRRPILPQQQQQQLPTQTQKRPVTITIDSDDEGPKYQGGSSDDEREDLRKSDIKPTNFQRRQPLPTSTSLSVPESPQSAAPVNSFASAINRYRHDPTSSSSPFSTSSGVKRSADVNAAAYGNSFKRPRQTAPSRAIPVVQQDQDDESDMSESEIDDYNLRQKVRRLHSTMPCYSVRQCYRALLERKGHYDDAVDHLLLMSEGKHPPKNKNKKTVDLTGSDDELLPTPAATRKPSQPLPKPQAKQQAKAPQQTIRDKWAASQQPRPLAPAPRKLDVFDTPPKQGRRLVRGRKRSSSPVNRESRPITLQEPSDDEDGTEPDSGVHSAPEDSASGNRLLNFFNNCTVADLTDTAVIDRSIAEHILSNRPFNTVRAIEKIEDPKLKTAKNRRSAAPVGERVADKVAEMLTSYNAVDFLVRKCEALSKPLTAEMKSWGVKIDNSDSGELDLVSLAGSETHDSGIGTPVSDDDNPRTTPRNFFKQPASMNPNFKLKDYQVVGMNWLNLLYTRKLSCILADDMGLGKTYQVIAFLSHLRDIGENGPHLVVVPAATLENWLKEFQQFAPQLTVMPYYSTKPNERIGMRDEIDEDRDNINVLVTTYTLAKQTADHQWLKDFGFTCTVFDEGHVLKNADSQVSKRLVRIKSKFRLLLTGTPLQNNLKELISLLAFMMPDMFREKSDDLKAIFTHKVKALDENHEALLSAQRIARARSMLTPFILRRKKYQVLKDLPKKERRVEYCDLTPEQAEVYQKWLLQAMDIRERRERGEEVVSESSHILMKLRQAAIHPFLFRRLYKDHMLPKIAKKCLEADQYRESNADLIVLELTAYSDMEVHALCERHVELEKFALNDHEWLASGKVQKTLELLRRFMADGHRTLIFSQFVMVLDILELVFEREGIDFFRLDGNTKVSERQDLIDEFSAEDNRTPVFMLSTKAGGAGINLATANKVIIFDSGFNPQDDIQAENRAHRIGQVKEVEVVRLVTRGTVEEQIYAMGQTKVKLDERVAGVGEDEEAEAEGGKKGKKDDHEKETKAEAEGRQVVEDMLFSKLKAEPEKVIQEATSPVQVKKSSRGSQQSSPSKSQGKRKNSVLQYGSQTSTQNSARGTAARGKIDVDDDDDDDSQKTLTEKAKGIVMKDDEAGGDVGDPKASSQNTEDDMLESSSQQMTGEGLPSRPKRVAAAAAAKSGRPRR